MVQGHSDVKGVSVSGEVLPGSLRPAHRLQCRKLNATLIISTCTRLMSRHLKLYRRIEPLLAEKPRIRVYEVLATEGKTA